MTVRIAVAGGAGFIGSRLCAYLLDTGNEVVCVDDFSSGYMRNIAALTDDPDFVVVHHDIVEPLDLQVDRIYNLACPASPRDYQADPIRTIRTCVEGSMNLLECAAKGGSRILLASTSEIYGVPLDHPQVETCWGHTNSVGPRGCYSEGKRCAESLFTSYESSRGTQVRIARLFNAYGPHMSPSDGRVVSSFVVCALAGAALRIHGDGSQTRSFCYVDDIVDGLVCLMETEDPAKGPFNLGNPEETAILELARRIKDMSASPSLMEFQPLPIDDPPRRCPDIHKASSVLGWAPRVGLNEGLRMTIDYFAASEERGVGMGSYVTS